jgi:hypothetical protein
MACFDMQNKGEVSPTTQDFFYVPIILYLIKKLILVYYQKILNAPKAFEN